MTLLLPLLAALTLDVSGCPSELEPSVRQLVALELETAVEVSTSSAARFDIRCAASDATLFVENSNGRVERALALTDVPVAARARLVALALIELLRSPDLQPAPVGPLRPAPPSVIASHATPSGPDATVQLALGPGVAIGAQPGSIGVYLAAEARLWLGAHWGLRGGLAGTYVGKDTDLGRLTMLDASIAGLASVRLSAGGWDMEAGVGGRIGYARLRGDAQTAGPRDGRVAGFWAGPTVGASTFMPLSSRIGLGAQLDAGFAMVGVIGRVDGEPALGVDGFWLRVGALLRYAL